MTLLKPKENGAKRLKEYKWALEREEMKEYEKKIKAQEVKISEEEHLKRIELLKSIGLNLNCKEVQNGK